MKYRLREHHGKFAVQVCVYHSWLFGFIRINRIWKYVDRYENEYSSTPYYFANKQEAKDQIAIFEKPDKIHEV